MSYTGYSTGSVAAAEGVPAAVTIYTVRSALLQRRRLLVFDVAGEKMVSSPSPGFEVDANNGPRPGPLVVTRVDGTKSIHIRFSVTTWMIECPGVGTPSALVSNSYGQSHGVDSQQRATVTTTGQAMFRTDVIEDAGNLADDYRGLIAVPVPRGFQRVAAQVAITPARNALTYQFVDVERFFDLGETDPRAGGSGVLDCDVTRSVSSTGTRDMGVVSFMTLNAVQVQVTGSKQSSNWRLTQFAFQVAQSVLPIGDPTAGYLRQISVSQKVTGREVVLRAEMLLTPKAAGKIGTIDARILREDNIFAPQGGINPAFLNRGGTAGTYANELKASPWRDLCTKPVRPSEGQYDPTQNSGNYSDDTGPVAQVYTVDVLPDVPTKYSYQTESYAYTDYEINISHHKEEGYLMCPVAGAPASDPGQGPGYVPGQSGPNGEDPLFGTGADQAGGTPGTSGASGPVSAQFLTVCSPWSKRVVEVEASRVGFPPELPARDPDPNLVLLEATPAFRAPALLPDGSTYLYRAAIRMVYGLKKPLGVGDSLPMGAVPYADATGEENVYPPGGFVDGLADGPAYQEGAGDGSTGLANGGGGA